MKNKLKTFLFTRFTLIVAGSAYVVSQVFAFLTEILAGHTSVLTSLFLRGSTILLDLLLIIPAVLALVMTIFRKKIIKSNIITVVMVWLRKRSRRNFLAKKSVMTKLYFADTTALICLFYLPYVLRLWIALRIGMVSRTTFWVNIFIGLGSLLVLGFFGKRIIKKLNRTGRKKLKQLWIRSGTGGYFPLVTDLFLFQQENTRHHAHSEEKSDKLPDYLMYLIFFV